MTHIKLDCATLGKKPGDILEIGEKEDQIPPEDAEILISERMAEAYELPVTSIKGESKSVKELKAKVAELEAKVAELEGQLELVSPPAGK